MAKARSSASPAAWTSWSPDHLINQTIIHRRYVQIPSDQKTLLDRQDAWSTGGVPSVPARVLDDLRAHPAKSASPRSQPTSLAAAGTGSDPGKETLSSPLASPTPRTPTQEAAEGDCRKDGDAAGTPIPWSLSPSSHLRGPCRQEELATTASESSRHSPECPNPRPRGNAPPFAAFYTNYPPSSGLASEPGLEVEAPRAIIDAVAPVNREAVILLEPTPPSAQIIHCTLTERTSPAQAPEPKRLRLMKPPAAVFGGPDPAGHKRASRLSPTKAVTAALSPPFSLTVRSPSPVPGASLHHKVEAWSVMLPAADEHASETSDWPPALAATSEPASNEKSSNSADKVAPNDPPSQVPFTAFKLAYPDYEGSLGDYIRGIIYTLKLQKDKALPEFLYDDFIRFFARDYVDYIGALDVNEPALPAIQRYNETVSGPVFTKGILTKDNIKNIATQYPEKLRSIQQRLKSSKTGTPNQVARHEANTGGGVGKTAQWPPGGSEAAFIPSYPHLTSAAAARGPEPATHEAESSSAAPHVAGRAQSVQDSRRTAATPEGSTDILGLLPAHQADDSKPSTLGSMANTPAANLSASRSRVGSSFPDIEPSQSPQGPKIKLPRASIVASIAPSQLSNPDSIPEASLKRRPEPRGPARSSAGELGAEFKRSKTTADNPKTRDLLWRKFLLQRDIQSSAPRRSAPS